MGEHDIKIIFVIYTDKKLVSSGAFYEKRNEWLEQAREILFFLSFNMYFLNCVACIYTTYSKGRNYYSFIEVASSELGEALAEHTYQCSHWKQCAKNIRFLGKLPKVQDGCLGMTNLDKSHEVNSCPKLKDPLILKNQYEFLCEESHWRVLRKGIDL